MRTVPFGSKVAVCCDRAVIMLPVATNAPADCAVTLEARPPSVSASSTTQRARNDLLNGLVP
jgi:hypothetical protein